MKKMIENLKGRSWCVKIKVALCFIPNFILYYMVAGLARVTLMLHFLNTAICEFAVHEPDFSGVKEVWAGLKGLWKQLKEKPRIVKIKVLICFVPALVLFVITNIGEFANKYGTKMISWAWRDPRYGKNLWGQKPYRPKEV